MLGKASDERRACEKQKASHKKTRKAKKIMINLKKNGDKPLN